MPDASPPFHSSETMGVLRATCYVLRATCYVLRATCYVLRATCYVLRATCYVLRATCYVLRATCYVLPLHVQIPLHHSMVKDFCYPPNVQYSFYACFDKGIF